MMPRFRALHPTQAALDGNFRRTDPLLHLRRALDLGRYRCDLEGRESVIAVQGFPGGTMPFLLISDTEQTQLTLGSSHSHLGYPNVGAYFLPDDIIRLICDLSGAGVRSVKFPGNAALAEECADTARNTFSLPADACRCSGEELIFERPQSLF
jgi:hypothetical protein